MYGWALGPHVDLSYLQFAITASSSCICLTGSLENDIALVELKEQIPFGETDRVGKIDLASPADSLIAANCTGYGWGCKSYGELILQL